MRKSNRLFFIIILLILTLFGCQLVSHSSQLIQAKVIRVVDGDTFVAKVEGKEEKIRLLLVDTPETVHPQKPVEPFGKEASQFTKEKLRDQTVGLEFDVQERDKYGRLLAYVYLPDGSMLNELLLEKGLAQVVVFQPNVKYVDRFREIQKKARENKVGIWSE
ncbi:thermonuclease family protein [Tepidibacillus fermentans]|uniref:Micrococcal nuclease n=1 Tax=Tepidibacillus fermentans TaxID=1281767 RepID=A0A4R3K630_9BACI|nr:thermonuclease family protein [Tepidibacillus fermentans]TCS78243.1 micrococcal nuclease [Tepidibacillus fermentans]